MSANTRLFAQVGVTILLTAASLLALSNEDFRASVSSAVDASADLAARAGVAISSGLEDISVKIRTGSDSSFGVNLGSGADSSAEADAQAGGEADLQFDLVKRFQAMLDALRVQFQTLFGLNFGS